MMRKNDDGGPAFPLATPMESEQLPNEGMTLRDWFAGKALLGELSSQDGNNEDSYYIAGRDEEELAAWCYEMADAMLEARKR